jgi:hypothetical protein
LNLGRDPLQPRERWLSRHGGRVPAPWLLRAFATGIHLFDRWRRSEDAVAKDHGSSVKNDTQYEGLRNKGMNKSRAAAIANSPGSSSRGGKSSGSSQSSKSSGSGSGGNKAQKAAAGRKGGKKSS